MKLKIQKGDLFVGTNADLSLFKRIRQSPCVDATEKGAQYLSVPVWEFAPNHGAFDFASAQDTRQLLFKRTRICMDVWEFVEERE